MSSMSVKVSLRTFKRDPRYQHLAHNGAELLVTRRGKPYLRVLPPPKPSGFLGAAKSGNPLRADFLKPGIPPEAWKAGQ
jgi:hypothetical protein